jgi:hypothetical protein
MLDAIIQHIKQVENPTDLMTNHSAPDSASMASSTDSLIGPPLLHHNSLFESETLDESSISDDNSTDHSISTDGSDYLGPPPPGSLMDLWDKPILANNTFHDLTDLFKDGIVTVDTANTEDTTSEDDSSIISTASMDFPINKAPVLHHVSATTQVAGLADTGELVDTGGNFCMCNDMSMLVNVQPITPFGINMAAVQEKTAPMCTHRGDFPIQMLDGLVYYTPMYYNSQASDSILSPQAICLNSNGYLTKWSQDGSTTSASGTITFFNQYGDAVILLI